jgi:hypothetical protein
LTIQKPRELAFGDFLERQNAARAIEVNWY